MGKNLEEKTENTKNKPKPKSPNFGQIDWPKMKAQTEVTKEKNNQNNTKT